MNSSIVEEPRTFQVDPDRQRGRLEKWDDIWRFVFGGNATFTLVSVQTRARYTYKVRKPKDNDADRVAKYGQTYFVSLLRGADNVNDYAYMGLIDNTGFHATKNSRMTVDAPSWKAFTFFLARMAKGGESCKTMEFWHEGTCGRCGRKLTVPESVERGIGPECAERMMA
jgi:hypothetical protein